MPQIANVVLLTLVVSWLVQLFLCVAYTRALWKPPLFPAFRDKSKPATLPSNRRSHAATRGRSVFGKCDSIRLGKRLSTTGNAYCRRQRARPRVPDRKRCFKSPQGQECDRQHLARKRPHCSLVCSSIIQAFDTVADRCDIIVFCAADTIVPAHWYWEVAAAMADPQVGCTLGNRWYWPEKGASVRMFVSFGIWARQ